MPEIIVLGGGVGGLATAVLLARDGHDVTLLERDADPVPATLEDAHAAWSRRGVAQFAQAHIPTRAAGPSSKRPCPTSPTR
jgi:2-polyprenyl-6-methoxyphenol hydroxylase-like FAD-dependent oxidoreductase